MIKEYNETTEILSNEYFDVHNYYTKKYKGNKVIILIHIGSFYECYATEELGVENIKNLGEKLGAIVTKKSNSKELSKNNPYMMGYPIYKIVDFIESLTKLEYTVIVINQITDPPKPKRKIQGIYSPATFIEKTLTTNKTNNLVCIILDVIKHSTGKNLFYIGISSYDLSTSNGYIFETVSKEHDELLALDETIRFLESNPSNEIIFHCTKKLKKIINEEKICDMTLDDIISYLNIKTNLFQINNFDIVYSPKYQYDLFSKIYDTNFIHENNLTYYKLACLSLASLLTYTEQHQKMLLRNLKKPIFFSNSSKLFLGNRAIDQLNIFNNKKCLFSIINQTKNILGKRFLQDSIINPLVNSKDIQKRYELIDFFVSNNINSLIADDLKNIYDLQKLVRRVDLENIAPCDFYTLYTSFKSIKKIFNNTKINNLFKINKSYIDDIDNFLNYCENIFDLDYIINLNFINYKEEEYNFFKDIYPELDEICETIKMANNFFEYLCKELEKYIDDKKFMKKNNTYIHLKHNDRDGHYLLISTRRWKILKETLEKIGKINVGKKIIKYTDLSFTVLNNNVKIQCETMKNISNNVANIKQDLAKKLKSKFYEQMNLIKSKYLNSVNDIIELVGLIDFINSGSICSIKYGYVKPEIEEYECSFLEAKELRHPVVEILNEDTVYHPHDIKLGKDNSGILLFGINSSGKSTLMKSIGLSIILAQIGYYVPAKQFKYNPYENLFTRIIGNDDIYKGLSSFTIEMLELIAILKRNNSKTLVLGDEICRGTEEKSANIIVAYMLEQLCKNNTTFISATHLHQICELSCVKNLAEKNKIKIMHLKVDYDTKTDSLIYSRELMEGQGQKFYGVTVAKYLMKDNHFNLRTKEIENDFNNTKIKKSKYNSNIYMIECHICKEKKNLETHHINFQKDCENKLVKENPHIKMNSSHNLVILCSKCHDMVDNNSITINGWQETSNGIILDYIKNNNKKSNKKFNEEQISLIKSYVNKQITLAKVKNILKEKNNITISTTLISKIWKNQY